MQDFFEIERLHRETLNPSGAFISNASGKSIPYPPEEGKVGELKTCSKDAKKIKEG